MSISARTITEQLKKTCLYSLLLVLLLFPAPASADLLFPVGSPLWLLPLVVMNYLLNLFILVVTFMILEIEGKGAKFLAYVGVVTTGGFLIDFGLFLDVHHVVRYALIFALLTVFNFLAVRIFYRLPQTKCLAVGLVMGILTNPFNTLILVSV